MSIQQTLIGWQVGLAPADDDGNRAFVLTEVQPNSGNVLVLPVSAETAKMLGEELTASKVIKPSASELTIIQGGR